MFAIVPKLLISKSVMNYLFYRNLILKDFDTYDVFAKIGFSALQMIQKEILIITFIRNLTK